MIENRWQNSILNTVRQREFFSYVPSRFSFSATTDVRLASIDDGEENRFRWPRLSVNGGRKYTHSASAYAHDVHTQWWHDNARRRRCARTHALALAPPDVPSFISFSRHSGVRRATVRAPSLYRYSSCLIINKLCIFVIIINNNNNMRNATASVVGRRWPPRPHGRRSRTASAKINTKTPFTVIVVSYVHVRYVYRGNWFAARDVICHTLEVCGPSSRPCPFFRRLHPHVFHFIFQFERVYPFLHPLYGSRTTDRPTWLENPCWCTSTIWWVFVCCNRMSWDPTNPTARRVIKKGFPSTPKCQMCN